ncbi:D-alanyl-D-alanine carboxypeptidase family protein, partial [Actinotalea ferrariae]|uniref:M15 family metallopeptidase n=1 Tax=Actinotalea ferrariae TaxID=1386098 RepID=UPI001ED0D500
RELRLKQQAACPPPFALIDAPAAADTAAAPAPRRGQARAAKSATVLALSGALMVSGFALQDDAAASRGALASTQAAERARMHQLRVDGAETARLTAEAEAWAGAQRVRALEVAAAAVQQADAVVQTATPLVQPDAVAPLDQKLAELEVMIGSSEQPEPVAVAPSPETVLRESAVERASRSDVGRTPLPADAAETTAPPHAPIAPVTDLETTQEMFAIAQEVAALTAQVQAATEARIAEQAAQAAAEAAAAEVARKVAVVEAAPNGEIPTDALCAPAFAADELLRCDAAAALERLNEVYRAEFGRDLSVVSSYRSYGMQVATRRSRGGLAATPGTSNHGRAVAVDFGDFGRLGTFRDPDYLWMQKNGPAFGWFHPRIMEPGGGGPQEPWHWEYGTDTGWDGPGL